MPRCEKCKRLKRFGERFCWVHRNKLIREMKKAGYLQWVPRVKWTDEPRVLVNDDQVSEYDFRVLASW